MVRLKLLEALAASCALLLAGGCATHGRLKREVSAAVAQAAADCRAAAEKELAELHRRVSAAEAAAAAGEARARQSAEALRQQQLRDGPWDGAARK